jgi:hypothetical protein
MLRALGGQMVSETFLSDLIANFIPDFIVAGIFGWWLAQFLHKKQTAEQIERDRKASLEEQRKRRNEILGLLKGELEDNIDSSEQIIRTLKSGGGPPLPGLTTEIWDTFTSSGQLSWLSEDLPLFAKLARGFHSVKGIVLFEKQYLQAVVTFRGPEREADLQVLANTLIAGYEQYIRLAKRFLAEELRLTKIKTDKYLSKTKK